MLWVKEPSLTWRNTKKGAGVINYNFTMQLLLVMKNNIYTIKTFIPKNVILRMRGATNQKKEAQYWCQRNNSWLKEHSQISKVGVI